jgi:hypothetical protein
LGIRGDLASQLDGFEKVFQFDKLGIVEKSGTVGIRCEKQGKHVHVLFFSLIGKYMRKVLSYGKNISCREFPKAIADVETALSLEYAADLNFFVLMQVRIKTFSSVFLEKKRCVFRFRYAEWQYFHNAKIAKYYLKIYKNVNNKV